MQGMPSQTTQGEIGLLELLPTKINDILDDYGCPFRVVAIYYGGNDDNKGRITENGEAQLHRLHGKSTIPC
jgi:hypothetical protein